MSQKRSLISLSAGTTLLIALIWIAGPFIAVSGKLLLANDLIRLVATLIVLIIAIVSAIPLLLKSFQRTATVLDSQEIHSLQDQIKILVDTTQKHQPNWVLVLGNEKAGKTSLLANEDAALQNFSHPQLDPTLLSAWQGLNTFFIEPHHAIENDFTWLNFLNAIKKKRSAVLFDHVIWVLDATTLFSADALALSVMTRRLEVLMTLQKTLRITLVVTQCDRLSGFVDFFTDLSLEERYQALGFALNRNEEQLALSELFHQRANAFVKRLGEWLIPRLHQEQNTTRRAHMKDFPWQMERLSQALEKLFRQLPTHSHWDFQGVYFTSSLQTGNPINPLTQNLSASLSLTSLKSDQPVRHKSYFTHDLFQQLASTPTFSLSRSFFAYWPRLVSYPVSAAIIVTGLFVWHTAYEKNLSALNMIQAHIEVPPEEAPWLSQLNTLQETINTLSQYNAGADRWIGLGQTVALRQKLQLRYQRLLTTNFVLYLDQIVTKQIQDDMDNNQPDLYNALQTYLMLISPDRLNMPAISSWFEKLWSLQYPDNATEKHLLLMHLNYLLQAPMNSWPVNYNLIKNAQQVLQQRPVTQIAFMMLQSQYQEPNQPLFSTTALPGFDLSHATIPALYSTSNFSLIYNDQIPQIAAQIERGNWVLGKIDSTLTPNENAFDSLTQQLRALYLENYVAAWQSALSQIKLLPPKQLSEAQNDIKILSDPRSPIWTVLQKALENPDFQKHMNDSNIDVSGLSDLMAFLNKNDLYQNFQAHLPILDHYITQLAHASDTKAFYIAAAERMQNKNDPLSNTVALSQKLPAPIGQWLGVISESVWTLTLDNAKQYLNTIWTETVVAEYQSQIANRYPLFKTADQDISLNSFNHFFGPQGTVELFFNNFLKPFVDTTQIYWTWKKIDGQSLAIPQEKLDMLIRASMIQKMFYADNPHSPTIKFSLIPISLSPNISRFVLNVGGQTSNYEPGVKRTVHCTWPGEDGAFVGMRFTTLNPERPSSMQKGFWSWFHLLDESQIQSTNDPKIFQVTFTLDNNQAVYQLVADNPVNPYQPQLLSSFRCPDNL